MTSTTETNTVLTPVLTQSLANELQLPTRGVIPSLRQWQLKKKLQELQQEEIHIRRKRCEIQSKIVITQKEIAKQVLKDFNQFKALWGEWGEIAIENFAKFHLKRKEDVSIMDLANSSAGIYGWYLYNHAE